jgi:BirA family biotin operon repressor/biotin-[acetyl-CoA-carboxylase] ligase
MVTGVPGRRARSALAHGPGARFADVRWVTETGSTNADALALARDGEHEGVVVVADHQTAGRGRAGRSWTAPPGGSLLASVLLRPPAWVAGLTTMALGLAAAEALDRFGVVARLKWPNDLVWPGDGSGDDRKLGGILAESDWPAGSTPDSGYRPPGPEGRVVVVVGIGINVAWPPEVPADLADIAIACSHIAAGAVDREDLLIDLLRRLDERYTELLDGGSERVLADWANRSATIGRHVRVDLGSSDVEGRAIGVTAEGHLVVATPNGHRTLAVGDVVHLRST